MKVQSYQTRSNKDVILAFLDSLSINEQAEGFALLKHLEEIHSMNECVFEKRKIEGHVWELKFKYHKRSFYCLPKGETIYLLHACKKQKNKTEMKDKHLALGRAKEVND